MSVSIFLNIRHFTESQGQCQERKIQFKNIFLRYSNLIPRGRSGKGPFVLFASFS